MSDSPRHQSYERVKAATVAICLNMQDGGLIPFGSGVNVHPRGVILTCKHVIEAAQARVDKTRPPLELPRSKSGIKHSVVYLLDIVAVFTVADQGEIELAIARFEVIHGPHDQDLAVARLRPDTALPFVELGNSDLIREGARVFTCGFPLGPALQPGSPTGSLFQHGIISGIRPHSLVRPRSLFFIDMTVNPGNSGGPLCSEDSGDVIGVVNAHIRDQRDIPVGIGCAVPSNLARPLADRVLNISDEEMAKMSEGVWPPSLHGNA